MFERYTEEYKMALDPSQIKLVSKLEHYKHKIEKENKALFGGVFNRKDRSRHGIYIHGDVGRGKSMLTDIFFDSLEIEKKLKIHFHEFMQNIHKSLHKWREQHSKDKAFDPIPEIAGEIADKYQVICFDELQVNNIADAMILYRLFKVLFDEHLYIFFTSNRLPEDLFKDGLQREHFLPFIDIVNKHLDVFELNYHQDYRLRKLSALKRIFIYPINDQTKAELENVIYELTSHKVKHERAIAVESGRVVHALNVYGHLAEFSFAELCTQPLGAIDYLSLGHQFTTVVVHNIPKLTRDNHNEALRFITLIDCLYQNRTQLVCLSEVPPDQIYTEGKNAFEFKRTASRLFEMSGAEYTSSNQTSP